MTEVKTKNQCRKGAWCGRWLFRASDLNKTLTFIWYNIDRYYTCADFRLRSRQFPREIMRIPRRGHVSLLT